MAMEMRNVFIKAHYSQLTIHNKDRFGTESTALLWLKF